MQLYKSRGFGAYFQDTFAFLKQNGKHLFKHFFIINGIFLMILMVFGYFFSKFYYDIVFGGLMNGNTSGVDEYINQNSGIFILLFLAFTIVALISTIISYSYVPIYLKLYTQYDGKNFTTTEIINAYKTNIGKLFIFLLFGILIFIPLMIVTGGLFVILTFTLIGILAIPIVIGAASLLVQGTLMEYLDDKRGMWDSFGYSWTLMISKFWAATCCVGIFYAMAYVAQNIVILVPYIIFIVDMMTGLQPGSAQDVEETGKTIMILMLIIFSLSFLVTLLINVILQLNQGVIYYSLKEDKENINTKSDIDLIGSSE